MIGPPRSNPYSAQIAIIFLIFHWPSWWQHVLLCCSCGYSSLPNPNSGDNRLFHSSEDPYKSFLGIKACYVKFDFEIYLRPTGQWDNLSECRRFKGFKQDKQTGGTEIFLLTGFFNCCFGCNCIGVKISAESYSCHVGAVEFQSPLMPEIRGSILASAHFLGCFSFKCTKVYFM